MFHAGRSMLIRRLQVINLLSRLTPIPCLLSDSHIHYFPFDSKTIFHAHFEHQKGQQIHFLHKSSFFVTTQVQSSGVHGSRLNWWKRGLIPRRMRSSSLPGSAAGRQFLWYATLSCTEVQSEFFVALDAHNRELWTLNLTTWVVTIFSCNLAVFFCNILI